MKKLIVLASVFLVSGVLMAKVTMIECTTTDKGKKIKSIIYTDKAKGLIKTITTMPGNTVQTYTNTKKKTAYMYMPAQKMCMKTAYVAPTPDAKAAKSGKKGAEAKENCTKPKTVKDKITIPSICK